MGMISMLLGAAGGSVVSPLPGGTSSATRIGASCTVSLTFASGGTVSATKSAPATWTVGPVAHNWYNGTPPTHYVRATLTAGALTSGTTGTWLDSSTSPSWSVTRGTPGTATATLTIAIATDAGGTNIVASGSYTIAASWDV